MVSTLKEANPDSTMEEFLTLSLLKNDNLSDTEEIEIDSILKNKENTGIMKSTKVQNPWRIQHILHTTRMCVHGNLGTPVVAPYAAAAGGVGSVTIRMRTVYNSWVGAEPLKGATPRRGGWRRSRPLLLHLSVARRERFLTSQSP